MKYFEYPKKNRYFFRFSSKSRFAIPSLFFRSSSVDPLMFLLTKLDEALIQKRPISGGSSSLVRRMSLPSSERQVIYCRFSFYVFAVFLLQVFHNQAIAR